MNVQNFRYINIKHCQNEPRQQICIRGKFFYDYVLQSYTKLQNYTNDILCIT